MGCWAALHLIGCGWRWSGRSHCRPSHAHCWPICLNRLVTVTRLHKIVEIFKWYANPILIELRLIQLHLNWLEAEHSSGSFWTQKTIDRAVEELSNDMQMNGIRLKLTELGTILGRSNVSATWAESILFVSECWHCGWPCEFLLVDWGVGS